jgi:hypothetical protein
MLLKIDGILESGCRHLPSSAGAVGLSGHAKRRFGVLAHMSEPADERWGAPLRTGFVILAMFETVYLIEIALLGPRYLATASYFRAFDIALAVVALDATYLHWFKCHWCGATTLCLGLILSHTSMGIAMAQDELLLMTLFAVLLGTAIQAPWNLRWQLGLLAAGLLSFMVVLLRGLVEPVYVHDHGACLEFNLAQKNYPNVRSLSNTAGGRRDRS